MMLNKLLANKKLVILAVAILLALIIGIVILVTPDSAKSDDKKIHINTEQEKTDKDFTEESDQTDKDADTEQGAGSQGNVESNLEVLEPDEVAPEDSSNASGSWGDTSGSNTQNGNPDDTDKKDEQTQSGNQNDADKEDDGEQQNKDKDILEDDISWGNIY